MPRGASSRPSSPLSWRQLGACAAVGLPAAVAVWLVATWLLPPALGATLLPAAAGLAAGGLAGMAWAARQHRPHRARLGQLAVALAIPALALPVMLTLQPEALDRQLFRWWMPVVAGAGAVTWLWIYFEQQSEQARRIRGPWLTAVLAGLALCAVLLSNGKYVYQALVGEHLRTWNVYHYYLGAKYFAELGYTDLYAATLAADDDWQRHKAAVPAAAGAKLEQLGDFRHIAEARDMATYQVRPRASIVAAFDRHRFSEARFAAFSRDTRLLRARLDGPTWQMVLRDWGYNPAPPRTVLDTPLTNWIALDEASFWLIANSDLPLFVLMFLALWWAFGLRVALAATLWANTIHFNRGRFAGGFLQYDWLASAVVGLALYHRQRFRLAGVVLSWAVMTRVFPVVVILPVLGQVVADWLRPANVAGEPQGQRSLTAERGSPGRLQFLAALGGSCAVLFALSHLTGRGLGTWTEWFDNIVLHHEVLPVDPMHLGLGRLAFHRPGAEGFWTGCYQGPAVCLAGGALVLWAGRTLGGGLLVTALPRRRGVDAMVLMLFASFLAVTMTRYYGTLWLLLFTLGASAGDPRIRKQAAIAGAVLLGMAASFYVPPKAEARYFVANYVALATFGWLCGHYALDNLRTWLARHRCRARDR